MNNLRLRDLYCGAEVVVAEATIREAGVWIFIGDGAFGGWEAGLLGVEQAIQVRDALEEFIQESR